MPKHYKLADAKVRLTVEDEPFAGGGEGNLHKIIAPAEWKMFVAKFYHAHKLNPQREEKIRYLITNPPHEAVQARSEFSPVVWLADAIYTEKDNQFVGFVMPFITGEKLEILCMGKLSPKLGKDWQRFDFRNSQAFDLRLKLCFNLSAAIYQVHSSDRYVLVDLKPENVVVKPNGLLSLVDTDSVEVLDETGKAIYPAPVATPEYTPAEYYTHKRREGETVGEEWDRFGLAVILYKLLFGIHPFAASNNAPYEGLVSLHEKIEHGLFVHAPSKKQFMKVVPPPHANWNKLSEQLRALFVQCFEQGHGAPALRPTAEEWCVALLDTFGDEKMKQAFGQLLFRHRSQAGAFLPTPSAKVALPKITANQDQWVPAELQQAAQQVVPVLSAMIGDLATISTAAKNSTIYAASWGLFGFLMLFMLVIEPGLRAWIMGHLLHDNALVSVLATLILVGIPQLLLPFVFTKTGFLKDGKKAALKSKVLVQKERYNALSKEFQRLQQQLIQSTRDKVTPYETFKKEADQLVAQLKKLLQIKDESVKELQKQQVDKITQLQERYIQKLQKNAFVAKFNAKTLEEAREKVELEEQIQLSKHKQKMQQIKDDPNLATKHKAEVEKLERKYKSNFQQIEQDYEAKRASLKNDIETQRKETLLGVEREGNVADRLSKHLPIAAAEQQKVSDFLLANGLNSMTQVSAIDIVKTRLKLKDGKEIDLSQAALASPMTIATLLQAWWLGLQDAVQSLDIDLKSLDKQLETADKRLTEELEVKKKRLEQKKKDEIQLASLVVIDAFYKSNISEQMRNFTEAKAYLNELLEEYNAELDPLSKSITEQYDRIVAECNQETERVQVRIQQQEQKHQEQLKALVNDPNYTQMQRQLQTKSQEIDVVMSEYAAAETELLNG